MMMKSNLLALTLIFWCFNNVVIAYGADGTPQTHPLITGCSTYNASNLDIFFANINATFSSIRDEVSKENKHFATADETKEDVSTYTMFQCRNYLSKTDCLACFNTATTQIRNCSAGNGARIIYDGCFLRYESENFYDKTTGPGNGALCGNTSATSGGFGEAGQQVLMQLQTATPKIKGFYAATKTQVAGLGAIYAVAQCVETASEAGCLNCTTVGFNNLQRCLPNTEGRTYDAGCFMRYSTTPFFADNQTIDITPYLNQGSTKGTVVNGGGVGVKPMAWSFIPAPIAAVIILLAPVVILQPVYSCKWLDFYLVMNNLRGRFYKELSKVCASILTFSPYLSPVTHDIASIAFAVTSAVAIYASLTFVFTPNMDKRIPEPTVGKALLKARSMFTENYCYVVDVADPDNLSISKSELHDLLSKPSLSGIPLLVMGNKIDKHEALSKQELTDQMQDKANAVKILVSDLKVFSTFNEELYKEITQLENEQLSKYGDTKTARGIMLIELKTLITDKASNLRSFFANINGAFSRLRDQVNNHRKHFATADEPSKGDEALTYAMFQCRNYLSRIDCLACLNTATKHILNCSAANGARVIYDGCFLRYETERFYKQTTESGHGASCGNTSAEIGGFREAGQQVLMQLQTATPKIKGFYAATMTNVSGGSAIYAVAQCVETATESDCLQCMTVGYDNLSTCLPNTEGRAYGADCFMRYSTTPFFAHNQTIDITPYLDQGANPQTHIVNHACSRYNASNLSIFFANINVTFSRIRDEVSNENKHFATANETQEDVSTYTMFQCRNYLSKTDCLACFHTATTQIRNCSAANGARITYDGCFLRYESDIFYDQTTMPGSGVSCGTTSKSGGLAARKQVLMELQTATPKTEGFYAATKTQVDGGGAIYAVAQCAETATISDCLKCMQVAYNNLQKCLPNTDGRAYDAGCFMRYSTTLFFADNQTFDITPYLDQVGTPQTNLINKGCSSYNATNLNSFHVNIDESFSRLKEQISNGNKHFATVEETRGEVLTFAMFQCRNYLSKDNCLACFNTASTQIRNCQTANGARITYDGCFLRYESGMSFYDETTGLGNGALCGNTSAETGGFREAGQQVLMQLQTATPKIQGFYAATKTQVAGVGAIYAIAQCVETASEPSCLKCLQVGYNDIQKCLSKTEGRAYDAGCFMRYSTTPFFTDNQTIPITDYLKPGGSRKKWAVIGGVVGGGVILLILLALFAWRRSKKPKRVPRGDILGATELKGPVIYKYDDLKAATKKFSNENKLGEGGFGDVYKGTLKNGKIVAVKKLVLGKSAKMEDDFESEVKLISNVHHRNLVRLLGCCLKGEERILVYEYMANSSLDKFIFAPEYAIHGQLSEKVDAYSYGIVVLEIISGQKSTNVKEEEDSREYLLQRTWKLYERDMHLELVDKGIDPNEYDAEEVKKIIEVALLCTQPSAASRPTMSEVVVLLKSKSLLEQLRPTMPVFVESNLRSRGDNSRSTPTTGSSSNATASITVLSAR
ncbi:hypothetical protein Fmac_014372 [Flemingia macrophylla]|uniref:Cysteine-rich receptor-like protein kinase 2 n=1 Tax=Flemingia macrophylla TaxID=520843 RepID=A0ABD1MBJ5_9FABA